MITRIWHGWTTHEKADEYETLLKSDIVVAIRGRGIQGFRRIEVLRRDLEDEVEFITVMRFDSMDAVRAFAGEDHEAAVVPMSARALLSRFDERSQHYELRHAMEA